MLSKNDIINENKKILELEGNFLSINMLKLNEISYYVKNQLKILELVAISSYDERIIIINLPELKIFQTIRTEGKINSLSQFKYNPNYLLCSSDYCYFIIYKFIIKKQKFRETQKLHKIHYGHPYSKLIILANEDLAYIDCNKNKNIIIFEQKKINGPTKYFKKYKEIMVNKEEDIIDIFEINENIFTCSIAGKNIIKFYKNNRDNYPLIGTIKNVNVNPSNKNGFTKLNDEFFFYGSYIIYIISIKAMEIIQKIKLPSLDISVPLYPDRSLDYKLSLYIHNSVNNMIYIVYQEKIKQYKIIKDDDNFVELKENDNWEFYSYHSHKLIVTEKGEMFHQIDNKTFCLNKLNN